MIRVFRLWAPSPAVLLALALVGCTTPPKKAELKLGWSDNPAVFEQRQQWRSEKKNWKLTAKVAIKTASVRESANLVWERTGAQSTLRLFGPLGAGAVKLKFDGDQALLTDSRGQEYYGDDEEALLKSLTGWEIPLDALKFWLFALPDPGYAYQYVDGGDFPIAKLAQLGWQIDYDKYSDVSKYAPSLPRKIVATKELPDVDGEPQAWVRLVVKNWHWQ